MNADQTFPGRTLSGSVVTVACPPWCTFPHGEGEDSWAFHESVPVAFEGPGDHYELFDTGEPYEVMWACLSAQAREDGSYGAPYIYFDTLSVGQGGRLDVAEAEAVLADLRRYTDRLQQLRDQLAKITAEGEQ